MIFHKPNFPRNVSDQEIRWLATPAALASFVLFSVLIYIGIHNILAGQPNPTPLVLGIGGMVYATLLFYFIMPIPSRVQRWKWVIAIINAVAIGYSLGLLDETYNIIPQVILILIAAIMVIVWDRVVTYAFIFMTDGLALLLRHGSNYVLTDVINRLSLMVLAVIITETIHRFVTTSGSRIKRLQILNEFAREIGASLNVDEVIKLVSAAIQNAIEADTYFLGIYNNEKINLHLIYDEGEFFPAQEADLGGSLSGWVIRHKSSLFIPDLRKAVELDGVDVVLIGKQKSNLCWMGVPMVSGHVVGMIVAASYTPNQFDRTDLELLENLAQQAALALDNAAHHAEVERRSHLDSLTNAFNHGHIVRTLHAEAKRSIESNAPLSLIMLDIDYFKQYNDNYGHPLGDQILTLLTESIHKYIHSTDAIGRWGGEEFAIVLPGANGSQAVVVAQRIRDTMNTISLRAKDGQTVPVPTVSQGIAVFPEETNDVDRLIDLADQRLYIAKERGRNQIEPSLEHWDRLKTEA